MALHYKDMNIKENYTPYVLLSLESHFLVKYNVLSKYTNKLHCICTFSTRKFQSNFP